MQIWTRRDQHRSVNPTTRTVSSPPPYHPPTSASNSPRSSSWATPALERPQSLIHSWRTVRLSVAKISLIPRWSRTTRREFRSTITKCNSIFGTPQVMHQFTTSPTCSSRTPVSVFCATRLIIRSRWTTSKNGTSTWRASSRRCSSSSLEAKAICRLIAPSQPSSHKISRGLSLIASLSLRHQLSKTSDQSTNFSIKSERKS